MICWVLVFFIMSCPWHKSYVGLVFGHLWDERAVGSYGRIHLVQPAKKPSSLKAAWELLELFYVDKEAESWLPERLVDWLGVMIFLLVLLLVAVPIMELLFF